MSDRITNKIKEIRDKLEAEGKVTNVPPDIVKMISEAINKDMVRVAREQAIKEAISERETAKVIINS